MYRKIYILMFCTHHVYASIPTSIEKQGAPEGAHQKTQHDWFNHILLIHSCQSYICREARARCRQTHSLLLLLLLINMLINYWAASCNQQLVTTFQYFFLSIVMFDMLCCCGGWWCVELCNGIFNPSINILTQNNVWHIIFWRLCQQMGNLLRRYYVNFCGRALL